MKWFICLLLAFGSLQAMSKSAPQSADNIGVRTLDYVDAKRNRPVVVEFWYPTHQKGPFEKEADVWVHPKEIRNSPLASLDKKYPLIIMSPGHGGDRRYLSWLVEALVKNGFMVASIEHHGNSWRTYNPLISLRFWERARDVSFALTELLLDPNLKNWIDPSRIGFVGYSLGGMTGLALGGARANNVKEIVKRQQEYHKEIEPDLVDQVDFSEAYDSFLEPRIKAIALLSPAAFVFPAQSLKQVKVPVALVASEGDEVLPFQEHAFQIITHLAPARLKLFRDRISHYVFLNPVSSKGKTVVRKEFQSEALQSDRTMVHKEVGDFVADFFKEQLKTRRE